MTRPVESALQRLRDATERIGANLVELELDSGRKLLEGTPITGLTATRWASASAQLTDLWQWHGMLQDLLRKADELRDGRKWAELEVLLVGPSIELSTSEVPLAERNLLGQSVAALRSSPDELLVRMSTAFDHVKTVISGIGAAWERMVPELDSARKALAECDELARQVAEAGRPDLERARGELTALHASLRTDPLSVDAGAVKRVVESIAGVRRDLDATAELSRNFGARLGDARALLEELKTAVTEGAAAHADVSAKISAPTVPDALALDGNAEARLTEISRLAERGAWNDARTALEQWRSATEQLLADARTVLAANRAPLEARNQFRALLDAYQVKARRLGLVEDPHLMETFLSAREALYTAPTDLALVGTLIRSYQERLSRSQSVPGGPR
jgi:hypothetical protein